MAKKSKTEEIMTSKEMTKQEVATTIWNAANALRGSIKPGEYKDYVLGFIFYKFLCQKEELYLESEGGSKEDLKDIDNDTKALICNTLGYFITYDDLFSSWKSNKNLTAGDVSDALSHFNDSINDVYKKVFLNILSVLRGGIMKFGDNAGARDKTIRDLIAVIEEIPATSDDYDVLGYIYEFFVYKFASTDDGEYYTPHEISELISKIIAEASKGKKSLKVYDPTSGSAGLLLTVGDACEKYIPKDKIEYFGQEKILETYNLSRMNLNMKGIAPSNIFMRNGDTLADDWPYFDENTAYSPLFVDACVANPPYSLNWNTQDADKDERFKNYGVAPSSKADYAFLLHCLYHLKPDGVMGIVLPHGVLFRGGSEGAIRKALIENHQIDTIIGLPANLFFATSIPTIIMILRKTRKDRDILFIDASKECIKEKKQNKLTPENIMKIFDAVVARKDIEKFAHLASYDEIKDNEYNLNIPRYVDTSEKEEPIDIVQVSNDIAELESEKKKLTAELNEAFKLLGIEVRL